MENSQQLWQRYHDAIRAGNKTLADAILKSLHSYKGNPPPRNGGCAKCRKRVK